MSTLSIRLPNSLHQHAKRLAQTEGIAVNQLVSSALVEKLSALDAKRYLNERAKRGREVDINAILAKVPDTEPEPENRVGSDAENRCADTVENPRQACWVFSAQVRKVPTCLSSERRPLLWRSRHLTDVVAVGAVVDVPFNGLALEV